MIYTVGVFGEVTAAATWGYTHMCAWLLWLFTIMVQFHKFSAGNKVTYYTFSIDFVIIGMRDFTLRQPHLHLQNLKFLSISLLDLSL